MIVWKSTLVSAERRFAESTAALKLVNSALVEQLRLAEEHYQQMREDLRLAVGLKPRQIYVPTPDVERPEAPQRHEVPTWAKGVNTPRDLKQKAEAELARKFAEQEMQEASQAIQFAAADRKAE